MTERRRMMLGCGALVAGLALGAVATTLSWAAAPATGPVKLTAKEDLARMCALVGAQPVTTRPQYNYDESQANPYPKLPDALAFNEGTPVVDGKGWQKRRGELMELFAREVYGRTPKTPAVTWEVVSRTEAMNGEVPVVTKQLAGHVDNSLYPQVSVNIQVTLTTPRAAQGRVPVIMQFGFGGFGGGRGPGRGAGGTPATTQAGARGGIAPGGGTPGWQQQLLAKGWGYAVLNTGSVQADNGAGLTAGIIGLVNRGQPRQPEDWGVLAAWSWGASRALDYFQTDEAVDAKRVGLEGHSRWGKATIVAMALDERFAIAYVSSSGEGGARLHRRNFGEPLDAVCIAEEYHWMAGNFLKYARNWDKLPVDSHELIALCAPRPVLITGGTNADRGVDARGMFLAAAAASPVYELLGKKGLGTMEMPPPSADVNSGGLMDGELAFRQHEGPHTDALNWPAFIRFASRYFDVQQ